MTAWELSLELQRINEEQIIISKRLGRTSNKYTRNLLEKDLERAFIKMLEIKKELELR